MKNRTLLSTNTYDRRLIHCPTRVSFRHLHDRTHLIALYWHFFKFLSVFTFQCTCRVRVRTPCFIESIYPISDLGQNKSMGHTNKKTTIIRCICSYNRTLNFFPGFAISNSDICRRGQSAFTPPGICTIAPKLSTERILAFTTIPGLTSEWVNTASSKALACMMWKHKIMKWKHPTKLCNQ